jgi:glycosyltransferase involved in cell wall biosynthesis
MKIAIDVSPLQSGHKIRGVGFYLEYLKQSLLEYFPEHNYTFFTDAKDLKSEIDVVHFPYFDPFFFTLPATNKYKTVVTVHDLTPLVFPEHFPAGLKGNFRWQLQKFRLRKAHAIIADSHASKKDIIKIAGVPENKVSVAYLAAGKEFVRIKNHEARIKELKRKYDLPEKFALYVGDVTWNKNVPNLVKAIKKSDIPLVMVGKSLVTKDFDKTNPWNKDLIEVQTLVENEKNIFMLGFVPTDDLVVLYNAATLFVFPSIYEGFGLPVIEAMQSGCPVVTTSGGSLKEVAGDAAIFADGKDIDNLAKKLQLVFTSKTVQKELSAKGLKQAHKFNWKKTAEETINTYKKACGIR